MDKKICFNCFAEYESLKDSCPHCGYKNEFNNDIQALACGSTLNDRYRVGRVLDQDGFCITYAAKDIRTGERVAIKEFFPKLMAVRVRMAGEAVRVNVSDRERFAEGKDGFLEEAKILAELANIPNIVHVKHWFEENGTGYFVTEHLDGVSMEKLPKRRLSWIEVKNFIYPILSALVMAHERGIIHCDISPEHILFTKSGQVYLTDFSAVRYSLGKGAKGLDMVYRYGCTPRAHYAPREQYSSQGKQGSWTDVYAVAAVIYRALTGEVLPESVEREEGDLKSLRSLGADITPELEKVLLRALAVKPENRCQSMGEFFNALMAAERAAGMNSLFEEMFGMSGTEVKKNPKQWYTTSDRNPLPEVQKKKDLLWEENSRGQKKAAVGLQEDLTGDIDVDDLFADRKKSSAHVSVKTLEAILYNKSEQSGENAIDFSTVKVGDYITFGSYQQSDDSSKGKEPIRWRVLSKEAGKALVISEQCLDARPYHKARKNITWEECTLRHWLNHEFLEKAFTERERAQITSQLILNPDNPRYSTRGGAATMDQVFLLSIDEAEKYFSSSADRIAKATAYAKKRGCYVGENAGSWWWLRSPGIDSSYAAGVGSDGDVRSYGRDVDYSAYGLRPALYISC